MAAATVYSGTIPVGGLESAELVAMGRCPSPRLASAKGLVMNPLTTAIAASAVRWLMVFAGAHGVELGNDQAESIVNAALVIGPLLWSILHKKKVDTAIKDAKAGV